MRLATICTEPTALPCLDALRQSHQLVGLGIPQLADDTIQAHLGFSQHTGIPLTRFARENLAESLGAWFGAIQPELLLVFGFPWRLPMAPVAALPRGGFNVHYGALPQFRGPQPLFWAVREQSAAVQVTIHALDEHLDHGPIAIKRMVALPPTDTLGLAISRLAPTATEAVVELLDRLAQDTLSLESQPGEAARYWPRPVESDLTIDWQRDSAASIAALVRAANPFHGGALTHYRGQQLRIWQVSTGKLPGPCPPPGTIIAANAQQGLATVSQDGHWIRLEVVSIREGLFTGDELVARAGLQPGGKLGSLN
ncbi:MAG TPA: formyltransferase family protein [Candidatus Limnocylindria bacterium]|jgi:methionyl-tRNA formyltransferase|nr:formyltransferase family protein [Candidatus Limnocylindria bacterium]